MYNGNIYNPYLYAGTQRQEVVRVNGRNGAEAYQMAPNSSILLLDETAPIVWLKTTDGASYPTLNGYVITPLKDKASMAPGYADLEERIKKLEEAFNNGSKSNASKSKSNNKQTADE